MIEMSLDEIVSKLDVGLFVSNYTSLKIRNEVDYYDEKNYNSNDLKNQLSIIKDIFGFNLQADIIKIILSVTELTSTSRKLLERRLKTEEDSIEYINEETVDKKKEILYIC